MRIRNILLAYGLAALLPVGYAFAQSADVVTSRRIAATTAVALEEYALGVQNGRVVSSEELDEARSFIGEVRKKTADLSPAVQSRVVSALDQISAGVQDLKPASELEASLDRLRHDLERTLNAPLDPMPAAAPSLARAAKTFHGRCAICHGTEGRGDGPKSKRIDPKPTNFTLRDSLSTATPLSFYRKITVGVSGTEMPDWEKILSMEDRWGLALYVSGLRYSDGLRSRGDSLLRAGCPDCLPRLSDVSETAGLSDDSLKALLATSVKPAPGDSDLTAMTAFARTSAAAEALGGDRLVEVTRTLARTGQGLDRAVELARGGDRTHAQEASFDAYLDFERIETPLRARDSRAAGQVEHSFADFRAALAQGTEGDIGRTREAVDSSLAAAKRSMTTETQPGMLFGQSFIIMVREGLEAILIIGALVAFLTKAGAPERKREIGWGVGAALAASGLTAIVLATVFQEIAVRRDALEGFIMLIAAAVLFSVSYWLVSKIEVKKWHSFVGAQIRRAITSRRTVALAAVAFLAVYREGFETVLFYAALFASSRGAPGGTTAIAVGIVLGFAVLCVVYYAIQRYGVKLPLKPFFGVTSALLYVMAFSFAGQGIAELQEAGYVPATPIRWAPTLPALGIFPTTQTLVIQLALALALVAALAWIFWLEPKKA